MFRTICRRLGRARQGPTRAPQGSSRGRPGPPGPPLADPWWPSQCPGVARACKGGARGIQGNLASPGPPLSDPLWAPGVGQGWGRGRAGVGQGSPLSVTIVPPTLVVGGVPHVAICQQRLHRNGIHHSLLNHLVLCARIRGETIAGEGRLKVVIQEGSRAVMRLEGGGGGGVA